MYELYQENPQAYLAIAWTICFSRSKRLSLSLARLSVLLSALKHCTHRCICHLLHGDKAQREAIFDIYVDVLGRRERLLYCCPHYFFACNLTYLLTSVLNYLQRVFGFTNAKVSHTYLPTYLRTYYLLNCPPT